MRFWLFLIAYTLFPADFHINDGRGDPSKHTKAKFVPRVYGTAQEWRTQRERLRRQVLVSAGLWPMPERGAVRVRSHGELPRAGYVVEKLTVETLPGFFVGANVCRPAGASRRRRPGVLIAHGHWKNGRVEHNDEYSVPALCAALAVNGFVALAWDMPGYNDTKQIGHKFGDSDEARAWAFGPLGLQLWNALRMADALAARADVDGARLAVTGASGGGTQTYLLAAVDDRIRVSIPAVMVSATFQGDDPCEMAPGLRIGTNNMELAAVAAPRPQLLLSTSKDWTKGTPEVEFPAIRAIYGLMGAAGNVEMLHGDAPHGYNATQRMAAVRFLKRHLGMRRRTVGEPGGFKGPATDWLVGEAQAEDERAVFAAWKEMMLRRRAAMTAGERVELLRDLTGARVRGRVLFVGSKGAGFLQREGMGDVVPVRTVAGGLDGAMLAVDLRGAASAMEIDGARTAVAARREVAAIDVFETGAAATDGRVVHGDHLVFHHSDDANRVQDIVTGAVWLAGRGATAVELVCGGGAGSLCRLAAAVSPVPLRVTVAGNGAKAPAIPGLATVYGTAIP